MKEQDVRLRRQRCGQGKELPKAVKGLAIAGVLVLVAVLAYFAYQRRAKNIARSEYCDRVSAYVEGRCQEYGGRVAAFMFLDSVVSIDVICPSARQEDVDVFQKNLMGDFEFDNERSVSLTILDEQSRRTRIVEFDRYGTQTDSKDYTNSVDDETAASIQEEYKAAIGKEMADSCLTLMSVVYGNDSLQIYLESTTKETGKLDKAEKTLVDINNEHGPFDMELMISGEGWGDHIRTTEISSSGKIIREDDLSNTMSDGEAQALIDELAKAFQEVCEGQGAALSEIRVNNDIPRIRVEAPFESKGKIGKLEKSLDEAIKATKYRPLSFTITAKDGYSSKGWTVDENDRKNVRFDYID